MRHVTENQMVEQWLIQIPITCILVEIIGICIIRSILSFMAIRKYKRKREDYYQALVLDNSYFSGAPSYFDNTNMENAKKENNRNVVASGNAQEAKNCTNEKRNAANNKTDTKPAKPTRKRKISA